MMGKRNNSIIISVILVAFLVGMMVSSPNYALALPPWANDILNRLGLVESDLVSNVCRSDGTNCPSTSGSIPVFIKHVTLLDDDNGHAQGWTPGQEVIGPLNFKISLRIFDPDLRLDSIVHATIEKPNPTFVLFGGSQPCNVFIFPSIFEEPEIPAIHMTLCTADTKEGQILHYTIVNPIP